MSEVERLRALIEHEIQRHEMCLPASSSAHRSDEIIGFHRALHWVLAALSAPPVGEITACGVLRDTLHQAVRALDAEGQQSQCAHIRKGATPRGVQCRDCRKEWRGDEGERVWASMQAEDSDTKQPPVGEIERLIAQLDPFLKHGPGCRRGQVVEPVACPTCGEKMIRVRNTSGYLNDDQFDAVKAGDWFCKRHDPLAYVWDHALPKQDCTCGLAAALAGRGRP